MRRFEFAEGTSNKFWEIDVSGNTHTVRFGKTGTNGQSSTKAFASAADAEKDAASLIASKVKKGYAEVAAAAKPVAAATAL
jgi:predicted DNA-binding WGR domain protein